MRKEVTVFIICFLALFADSVSGWQLIALWQNGEVNFHILSLVGILVVQIIFAFLIGLLGYHLLKIIYRKGLFY